ncbi:MAG TPA: hypothetical protein VMB78_09225 [Dissulfurispiraceae bacterium]|nr:hypothetical protein [Dissulfurispiraceae bacterium]
MKYLKVVLLSFVVIGLVFSVAFAAGDAEKGKALFNDPKAFGGEVSCASCHPDGKGLEKSGEKGKKAWANPGGKWLKLQDAINVCIVMANKGKAIDPHSADMKNLVAYIKSLGMKSMPAETPMKSGY